MNTRIQTFGFDAKLDLTDIINKKMDGLAGSIESIFNAEVFLKLDNNEKREKKICEIRQMIPGNDLFANRQCSTFEEAAKQVVEALQKHIEKIKP